MPDQIKCCDINHGTDQNGVAEDSSQPHPISWPTLNRRVFLYTTGAGAAAIAAMPGSLLSARAETPAGSQVAEVGASQAPDTQAVLLRVNGQDHHLKLEARVTLLDALREVIGLTGSKKGCDRGQCGACTVLIDGRRINACLTLAVMHQGVEITTIEGLATKSQLHPMQTAFLDHDAFQCGYCTPGQICSAVGMVAELRQGMPSAASGDVRVPLATITDAEIRERMSGNICRCGAYPNIVAAVGTVLRAGGAKEQS